MKYGTAARIYIVVLLLALAVDVKFLPLPALGVESVPLSYLLVAAGIAFPPARFRDFRAFAAKWRMFWIPAGAFLLSGLASAVLSPFPFLFGLKSLAAYLVFLFASFLLLFLFTLDPELKGFFLKALLGLALVLAVVAFFEAGSGGLSRFLAAAFRSGEREIFSGRARAASTLPHPNIFGCFMALAVLTAVLLRLRSGLPMILFALSAAAAGAGLVLSGSRNALVVALVPLAALGVGRKTRGPALAAFGILVLALIALSPPQSRFSYLWQAGGASTRVAAGDQAAGAAPVHYDAAGARKLLWRSAWAMFRDRPLFGLGPGGTFRAMKDYAPKELMAIDGAKIERNYLHAHSGPLNILAEFGAVGAAIGLVLVVLLMRNFLRRFGLFPPGPEHAVLLAVGLSFLADAFFASALYMTTASTLVLLSLAGPAEKPENE